MKPFSDDQFDGVDLIGIGLIAACFVIAFVVGVS